MMNCRAEKMFGIESRSLKACHELLEVRYARGPALKHNTIAYSYAPCTLRC